MSYIEKIARAMCEVQHYAATENELARAIDEVPGFLFDLRRHGLAVVPLVPTAEMAKVGVYVAGTGAVLGAYEAMIDCHRWGIGSAPCPVEEAQVRVLPDGRVSRRDAAAFLGMKPKTLAEWQRLGKGPKSILVGSRRFYLIDDLKRFAMEDRA